MRRITLALCLGLAVLLSGCVMGLDGRLLLTDADREQAIARYKTALAQEPDSWILHRRIGMVYFDLGDYAHAADSFQQVQTLLPGEPVSLLYLGLSRIGKGEREAGLDLLVTFRWPGKFYHQKYVQEEAARLRKHPETPAGEAIRDLLDALAAGEHEQIILEQDMEFGIMRSN